MRRLADIERYLRELTPSIARSIQPTVTRIDANLASIEDLLTKVVATGVLYTSAQGFAVTTALATKASITVTVPAGFTTAAVSVTGRVMALNPNATTDYLYIETAIGGYYGWALPLAIAGSGGSNVGSASFATTLTGLVAGSTFIVRVSAWTSSQNFAADPLNTAELSGSVLWIH